SECSWTRPAQSRPTSKRCMIEDGGRSYDLYGQPHSIGGKLPSATPYVCDARFRLHGTGRAFHGQPPIKASGTEVPSVRDKRRGHTLCDRGFEPRAALWNGAGSRRYAL